MQRYVDLFIRVSAIILVALAVGAAVCVFIPGYEQASVTSSGTEPTLAIGCAVFALAGVAIVRRPKPAFALVWTAAAFGALLFWIAGHMFDYAFLPVRRLPGGLFAEWCLVLGAWGTAITGIANIAILSAYGIQRLRNGRATTVALPG